jgi:hypothetical protein
VSVFLQARLSRTWSSVYVDQYTPPPQGLPQVRFTPSELRTRLTDLIEVLP